jgi:phospholipid/cholesterol/gamma-HCH transport system permease protein
MEPEFAIERHAGEVRLMLAGPWTTVDAERIERLADGFVADLKGASRVLIDLSRVPRIDTLGAWVVDRARVSFQTAGIEAGYINLSQEQKILLSEVTYHDVLGKPPAAQSQVVDILADVGQVMVGSWRDVVGGTSFLGALVAAIGRVILKPSRFRVTPLIFHLEAVGLRSVPIIALISFLVGCIVAQQGIFQLNKFGATPFVVDLIGILALRELGVLLTSIMVAGRSGSAFTAEIGSMKMREEIDALRVMGLDPIEVLVLPRIFALIIALPLLTFVADIAALFGGGVVAWIYGSISQDVYLDRLRNAVALNTFLVGIIKAPFMALVIGSLPVSRAWPSRDRPNRSGAR